MHAVRASSLSGFAELVRSLGQEPLTLLEHAGLPRECLLPDREDDFIPLGQFEQVLALASERTGTPQFAALLGTRQEPHSLLGAVGYAMQHASNLGAALEELKRYFFFQVRGARLELEAGSHDVTFSFAMAGGAPLGQLQFAVELCMGAGLSVMQALAGSRWRPTAVLFSHDPHSEPAIYSRLFGAPVRWGQERDALLFPRRDLNRVISSADPGLNRMVHRYLDQMKRAYRSDAKAQTSLMIDHALKSGHCSVDRVAALSGVHRRTLHRRLRAENTSFSELLGNVRQEMALRLLRDSDLPVSELAQILCYSQTSAFTRACQRWFGQSPRKLRAQRSILCGGNRAEPK